MDIYFENNHQNDFNTQADIHWFLYLGLTSCTVLRGHKSESDIRNPFLFQDCLK